MCGPKPGSDEAKKEKPKNSGSEFLFGDDFRQVTKDARNLHNMAIQASSKTQSKARSSSSSFLENGNKPPQPPAIKNQGKFNKNSQSNNNSNKGKQFMGKKN